MDVDCSSITYDTTPSEVILEAAEKAKKYINEDLLGTVVPLGRTESANESLSNSLLTRMDCKNATDAELTEAFCRDIDSFSFELQVCFQFRELLDILFFSHQYQTHQKI